MLVGAMGCSRSNQLLETNSFLFSCNFTSFPKCSPFAALFHISLAAVRSGSKAQPKLHTQFTKIHVLRNGESTCFSFLAGSLEHRGGYSSFMVAWLTGCLIFSVPKQNSSFAWKKFQIISTCFELKSHTESFLNSHVNSYHGKNYSSLQWSHYQWCP